MNCCQSESKVATETVQEAENAATPTATQSSTQTQQFCSVTLSDTRLKLFTVKRSATAENSRCLDGESSGTNDQVALCPKTGDSVSTQRAYVSFGNRNADAALGNSDEQTCSNDTMRFEFETDDTSRLTNEQLRRLLLLEQLAYARLKHGLLTQRDLADSSQS